MVQAPVRCAGHAFSVCPCSFTRPLASFAHLRALLTCRAIANEPSGRLATSWHGSPSRLRVGPSSVVSSLNFRPNTSLALPCLAALHQSTTGLSRLSLIFANRAANVSLFITPCSPCPDCSNPSTPVTASLDKPTRWLSVAAHSGIIRIISATKPSPHPSRKSAQQTPSIRILSVCLCWRVRASDVSDKAWVAGPAPRAE
ncbi:uncharacterized protein J3D65DRAFT_619338 [Phyllosticta citribraziliensis]|uniref:Uncharacterized protein n=1 Tax=Phyllosticta citribraziliensis TaxID=989973 RepID=A0ABR1LWS7_9PEZI